MRLSRTALVVPPDLPVLSDVALEDWRIENKGSAEAPLFSAEGPVLEEKLATVPQSFALEQNSPNPFNGGTVIRLALPSSAEVELALFNMAGQKVATLVQGTREAGVYAIHWDGRDAGGRDLASGMYLYLLRAGAKVEKRKLLLLR